MFLGCIIQKPFFENNGQEILRFFTFLPGLPASEARLKDNSYMPDRRFASGLRYWPENKCFNERGPVRASLP